MIPLGAGGIDQNSFLNVQGWDFFFNDCPHTSRQIREIRRERKE